MSNTSALFVVFICELIRWMNAFGRNGNAARKESRKTDGKAGNGTTKSHKHYQRHSTVPLCMGWCCIRSRTHRQRAFFQAGIKMFRTCQLATQRFTIRGKEELKAGKATPGMKRNDRRNNQGQKYCPTTNCTALIVRALEGMAGGCGRISN